MREGGIPINSKAKAFAGRVRVNLNHDIMEAMKIQLILWELDMRSAVKKVALILNNIIGLNERQCFYCLDNLTGNHHLKERALGA